MVKCYTIHPNYGQKDILTGYLKTPFKDGKIKAGAAEDPYFSKLRPLKFDNGYAIETAPIRDSAKLTPETRAALQSYWYHTGTRSDQHTVMNCFSANLGNLPLVTTEMKALFEKINPGMFEYLEITQHRARDCEEPAIEGSLWLINLLERRDGWDQSEMNFSKDEVPEKGLTFHYVKGSRRVVRRTVAEGSYIWRDRLTRDVICTDAFRDPLTEAGVKAWVFHEIEVSER